MPFATHYQSKGYYTPSQLQNDHSIVDRPVAGCYLRPRNQEPREDDKGLFADEPAYNDVHQPMIEIEFAEDHTLDTAYATSSTM